MLKEMSALNNELAADFQIHSMLIIAVDSMPKSRKVAPLNYNGAKLCVAPLTNPWRKSGFQLRISTVDFGKNPQCICRRHIRAM